jgi:hypothetical protein
MPKTSAAKHSSDYRKRSAEKNQTLGIEKLSVEVSADMTQSLQCLMREHGFSQRQEVYQTLLRHVIGLDFDEAAKILRPITSGFDVSPKLARQFRNESLKELRRDPGDEHIPPSSVENIA